jgi:hypothetical protein
VEDEIGGAYNTNGRERNAYKLVVRKQEERRPLGRLICRWVDDIKTDLVEIE